jgi:hypothetical protein
MTADEFRSLALSLPESIEHEHMGHPDFRVGGKIFATLGPDEAWGMVKLNPEQQTVFVRTEPDVFQPVNPDISSAVGPSHCSYRISTFYVVSCHSGGRPALRRTPSP